MNLVVINCHNMNRGVCKLGLGMNGKPPFPFCHSCNQREPIEQDKGSAWATVLTQQELDQPPKPPPVNSLATSSGGCDSCSRKAKEKEAEPLSSTSHGI